MTIVDNPKASPITKAYFEAQKPLGGLPETPRERSLFEALQSSLQTQYEEGGHERCKELEEDLRSEIEDYEREHEERLVIDDPPEPTDLVAAKRIAQDRRQAEPLVAPTSYGDNDAYRHFAADRDATDLLESLIAEVEAFRKLVKATP